MAAGDAGRAAAVLVGDFARLYPADAARAIERLPDAASGRWVEAMPDARLPVVLEQLLPEYAAAALGRLQEPLVRRVLTTIEPAPAARMLEWLEPDDRERCLALVDPATARELRALASYPEDAAGRLMDARVPTLRDTATAREALLRLRRVGRQTEGDIYVVDAGGRLVGVATAQDVATAALTEPLARLARPRGSVLDMATRAEIVERLAGANVGSLPVVDVGGGLLGVIRPATLIAVAQQAASADMQAMVGVSRDERALSPVGFAVKRRLPWLHVNLATAFLAAAVVGVFEDTIARFTALAVLLPVVAGQSGNTGAQALAVTMRGLALRELRPRLWPRVLVKEAAVALINGVAVAVTTSAGVWIWSQSAGLAMVIGLAMIISMLAAGAAGAVIPIALTVSGQDPAQASSIILTTVTDVVGFLSFLGLATVFASLL